MRQACCISSIWVEVNAKEYQNNDKERQIDDKERQIDDKEWQIDDKERQIDDNKRKNVGKEPHFSLDNPYFYRNKTSFNLKEHDFAIIQTDLGPDNWHFRAKKSIKRCKKANITVQIQPKHNKQTYYNETS
ncbi:MAG: hypothetical protein ACK5JD_01230 [Mangrovibacterium sp.]